MLNISLKLTIETNVEKLILYKFNKIYLKTIKNK